MRMKSGYFFVSMVLIIFILSINLTFVQAACSSDSQTILKLSAATNAHGAIYSDSVYSTSIWYNTIFGTDYTGASPHDCSANNMVLRLSATTNAHAEGPTGITSSYTNVCYGNLQCTERTNTCDTGESLVATLSATTNAHLASDDSIFTNRICCKAASLGGAQWTGLNDSIITTAQKNDLVKLVLTGSGLTGNVEFKIYEDLFIDLEVLTKTETAQSSDKAFTYWTANVDAGEYYFKAKVISTGQEVQSGNLVVSGAESNSPPTAGIDVPKHGAVYAILPATGKAQVFFNHTSTDRDDNYSIKWVFGDGQEEEKTNCIANNCNTTYEYTNTKFKTIKLIVTDSRGATSSITRNIMIVNPFSTLYPFPLVWNPLNEEYKPTQNIEFNATSSYAIKSESGNLYCVAGNCPQQTSDATPLIIANDASNPDRAVNNINFTWTIDGNFKKSKFGLDGASFPMLLPTQGKHTAKLQAFFEMAGQSLASDEVNINFTTGTAAGFCSPDRRIWTNPDGSIVQTVGSDNSQYCENSIPNCCPNNYKCVAGVGAGKGCQDNTAECEGIVEKCGDYTEQNKCEQNSCGAGLVGSTEYSGNNCGEIIIDSNGNSIFPNCGCKWFDDPTVSDDEECVFYKDYTDVFNPTAPVYYCEHSNTQITECSGGKRTITWTGKIKDQNGNVVTNMTLVPDEIESECPASAQKIYRCGFETKLPFFGIVEAIIAIGVLALFYSIRNTRKRR